MSRPPAPTGTLGRAYVGIGSNLEDPRRQVLQAFDELEQITGTHCVARSGLYRSAPLGPPNQPDYINAAAALDTRLGAHELLAALQAIEQRHGRRRDGERWGPRTLDLDLLLYADCVSSEPQLTLPHPELHRRAFVLYPLHEIAPDLQVPGHGMLADLLHDCPAGDLRRIEATP